MSNNSKSAPLLTRGFFIRRAKFMSTILDAIGSTPLVEIKKINPNSNIRILAKLEGFNPSGSIKDRLVAAAVEDAEKAGVLATGKTIIKVSNGNAGVSVAMVAAARGYKAIIITPENIDKERRRAINAFGAQLLFVKPQIWRQGAINLAEKMAAEDSNLVDFDQLVNDENCTKYYLGAGKEIIKQAVRPIDYFISCIGSGGTISGVARQLRQNYPDVRVIGIQPRIWGNAATASLPLPPLLKPNLPCGDHVRALVDVIVDIGEDEAAAMAGRLAREEGIFAGIGSGAAMAMAYHYAEKIEQGTIVAVFPDRGDHYRCTEIFEL